MKSYKKFGLGLVAASAALTLAACGGGSDSSTADSGSSASGGSDDNTLTVSVDKGYVDYINEIKGAFEDENGVTIEVIEKDMFDQLDALALDGPAGKAPDVMMSAYDRIGGLAQQGHLAEVTLGNADDYDETDQAQVTVDDKVYGAPAIIETLVLYYNKDLVDAAPTSFTELEALAEDSRFDFASESGKNTGFLAKWTDFYYSYGLMAGYGGYIFGEDGTDTSDIGLNNSGAVEGITYATDWFQNVWPQGMQDITSAGDFVTNQFTSGAAAAIIDGPWQAATYTDAGVNFGIAKIPTLANGEDYQAFGGGKGWVVSNYSTHKDTAQEFLDYLTNQENQEKLYEDTQEIPANQAARETASAAGNELTTAVIEQYASAQPMPNIPEMAEVWTGEENMMFEAASGTKTPQEAADDAVQTIKDAIEQKY
ncbi:extracellular solute-binding protein [Enterococcus sp. HY326]|uniref:extracellular solute-binding protein n=1 Tax=Enterococcus sp. HY326 TaxID=2971265 RepID=UPI00223F0428|nr:extracellular solute-binding protein [Enterococcus sp. HY326]